MVHLCSFLPSGSCCFMQWLIPVFCAMHGHGVHLHFLMLWALLVHAD